MKQDHSKQPDVVDDESQFDPGDIQRIALSLASREAIEPPAEVWQSIQTAINEQAAEAHHGNRSWRKWVFGMVVWMGTFLLLWGGLQPGFIVQIDPLDEAQGIYQVFRSLDGESYRQVKQFAPQEANRYEYTDILVWPFREYQYRIDLYSLNGDLIAQQYHRVDGRAALPAQLIMLVSSILLTYAVFQLARTNSWFQFTA